MIIYYLNSISVMLLPLETYAPLIVDADTPLTCPVAGEFFQPVGGWNSQISNGAGIVDHTQLSQSDLLNVMRQLPGRLALINLLSEVIFKSLYHGYIV